MRVVVIDGQSGRMGQLFIERARAAELPWPVLPVLFSKSRLSRSWKRRRL